MRTVNTVYRQFLAFVLGCLIVCSPAFSAHPSAQALLQQQYEKACSTPSDINEHVPVLRALAKECSSVVEIGLRSMVSSWGILQGLSENSSSDRSYLGIDIQAPPSNILRAATQLAELNDLSFQFWEANDMDIDILPAEMLFIDSLHTYLHLTYELEKFSPKISKYICMHDTSAPWGDMDDPWDYGTILNYPSEYSRARSGLWPAVEDFLKRHPEWTLQTRLLNNHGFTILKRVT